MLSQLLLRQVAVARGRRILFHNLNLDVVSGELLHLLGPNGVGKSSLLAAIAGLLPVYFGTITDGSGATLRSNQIAYLGHRLGLKTDLTALQNLQYHLFGHCKKKILSLMSEFDLEDVKDHLLMQLSAGQRQRLGLLIVLLSSSPLWLLDEAFICLDVLMQQLLQNYIHQHLSQGGMVIFTSHQQHIWLNGLAPRTFHLKPSILPRKYMELECLDSSIT